MLIIIIICVIVGLVIIAGISGFFIYKKYRGGLLKKDLQNVVKSIPAADHASNSHDSPGMAEEYEAQYHPKMDDIDIFSRGDPLKKQNDADSVAGDSHEDKHNDTEEDIENPNHTYNNSFSHR